ncbi:DUF2283 domain-containing protein [Thermodesulfovibrio sp. TK110]
MEKRIIEILNLIPSLLQTSFKKIWIDYDEEVDVLYISFQKPQQANDSIMEGEIVYHYRNDELVGVTILNAKKIAYSKEKVTV